MSERRIIRQRVGDVDALPDDIHPLLRRIYAGRGVASSEELDYSLQRLPDPARLRGMSDAVALLASHLGGRILVVGDFDADGATSCALAVRALESMGGADIGYLVPDRFRYGYGLTPEIVELARARRPDLIVTVDNGISSHQGVAAARAAGIDVLVTDHHLPGRELPDANVIVNPHLPGDTFAGRHLAGVGVIFHVMLALRRHLRAQGHFGRAGLAEPNMAEFLDLVALGTIADVVQLDHCNRVLVDQGLRRLRAGKGCPGIRALAAVAGRDERRMTAADLGFAVGPRLNAAGRLDDMSLGIECLLARRMDAAREMAARLDQLNRERREIEATMKSEAFRAVESLNLSTAAAAPPALCFFNRAWHQGVVGLVASRVKERVHRPVFAFAPADDGMLKGSGRSIPGVHLRDALADVAAAHPGLLERFGGHAMAAGLSLDPARLDGFREALEAAVARQLDGQVPVGELHSDGELDAACLNVECAAMLRDAGPWGQGFPEPLFHGEFEVLERRIVGEHHLKMRLHTGSRAAPVEAIAFSPERSVLEGEPRRILCAYRLQIDEYWGTPRLQLLVEYLEVLA